MALQTRMIIRGLITYRFAIFGAVGLLTLIFGYFLTGIRVNNDPTQTIPPDLPERLAYEKLQETFEAPRNILLIASFDSIPLRERIDSIATWAKRFGAVAGVENITHLGDVRAPVSGGLFGLTADYIISRRDSLSESRIRDRIQAYREFTRPFISDDQSVLSMIMAVSDTVNQQDVVGGVMDVYTALDTTQSVASLNITGAPLYAYTIDTSMRRDFGLLLPLCLVIVAALLFAVFRRVYFVAASLAIISIALVWTFGLLGLSGMPFSVVTAVIPVILFPVGVASAIHVFKTYQRYRGGGAQRGEAVERTFHELMNPIFLSAVTTFVGFASFSFSDVIWTRTFGIFTAIGVALALLLSIVLLPIFLSLDPLRQRPAPKRSNAAAGRAGSSRLAGYRRFIEHPWAWVALLAAIVITSALGFMRVTVEGNPIEMFPPSSVIRQSDTLISEHLGGTRFLTIMLEHKDSALLSVGQWQDVKEIRDFADSLDIVGGTTSMLPLLSRVSMMLTDRELSNASISMILGGRGLLGAKFGQFVNTWVSPDRKKTKIALICKNVSGTRFLEVSREIEARVSREYPDWNVLVAGPPVLNDAMTFVLIRTQISSLLLAFGSVLLVLCLLFRSFKIGLIALVPIALSTAFVYALMGLFGVAINAITVIIVNTCIGIGIDYAIHFAAGYLYVRGDYEDRMDALMATVRTKGSVIMFNTGVVGIGFLVLAFSSFPPIRDFGVFVFLSMVASSTFSLVFLPILFRLLRVEGKKSATRDTF